MQVLKEGKVPVCIRKDYIMYFEYFKGRIWFHIDILKWSASIKKSCDKDLAKLLDLLGYPILALIHRDNVKLKRFAELFGWNKQGQIVLKDGTEAYIYASKS